jgi:hypothetical protein
MKTKVVLAVMLGFLALGWTCNAVAATANGSFNFDFNSDPACTSTVTTDCIDHFEIWDVTGTPKKISPSPIPVPSPATSPVTFSFKVGPPYGGRKWSAVAVAKDGTTSDMTAPQSQATVQVRPGAPASFVINLN